MRPMLNHRALPPAAPAAPASLLLLLLLLLLAAGGARAQAPGYAWGGGACATMDDCSLGGECVASKCVCDAWFTGPQCDLLNLQRPRFDDQAGLCHAGMATYYSWGGRSILGPDAKYHLVASFMCRHATLDSWTTVSSSAHFVSDEPDGAFTWADSTCAGDICTPLVIPWSHNTVVASQEQSPAIIIAHIGDGVVDPSNWAPCFNKSQTTAAAVDAAAAAWPHEAYQDEAGAEGGGHDAGAAAADPRGILTRRGGGLRGDPGSTCYFHTADNWDGPWTRAFNNSGVSINCTDSWTKDCLVGNPAPFVFPNGTVNLYFTATTCPPNSGNKAPPCIAMARADTFAGPYQLATPSRPITYPESEDPSVFRDFRGNFHLVTNVNTYHARCAQGVPCGGHAWSRDGYVFSNLTVGAFGPVVTFKNGTEWRNAYVERPLVTMAADGVTPLAFHVGMGRASYSDSCNWVQLFCADGADATCGPTRFAPQPPPKNVTFQNGGQCLVIANATSFPCSGSGEAAGCPVLMGSCSDPSAQWQLSATDGTVMSAMLPGIGLDVDCDSPAAHTVVKALASGFAPVAVAAGGRLSVLGNAACFNTGQGPPRPVCGPQTEHTLPNQIQLAACSDATTAGWTVV